MGIVLTFLFAGAVLIIGLIYRRFQKRAAAIRAHGCGVLTKHVSKDIFSSFDFYMSLHMDIALTYRLHQRYGNTFQSFTLLTQPYIMTLAPDNIRAVLAGKDWGVAPMRLRDMEYFCGRGFITTDGETWQHSKKLLKPTFTKNNMFDLAYTSSQLDKILSNLPDEGSTVDLQPVFTTLFLNISLHFLLGEDLGSASSAAPYTSEEFTTFFQKALFYSMMRTILGRAWKLLPQKKYLHACKVTHEQVDYYIDQVLSADGKYLSTGGDNSNSAKRRSILAGLCEQTDDREFVRHQILQGMMASQETISALLSNVMWLLARHPQYWQILRSQVKDKPMEEFDFDTLLNFGVIQNIIFETLRLYPVFPLMGRSALKDTILPTGGGEHGNLPVFAPKTTIVVFNYYGLHRDQKVFGEDVETFRPERWESIKPDQWEYLAFGGGNRACLGRQKVLVEAAFVLIRLAKQFSTIEPRDSRDWKPENKLTCTNMNGCKVALHS